MTTHDKKIKLIDDIDGILDKLGKPASLYNCIASTLSVMQLKAIKAELLEELNSDE
jgi:hypothetical protein